MNPKYVGKTLTLPHKTAEELVQARKAVSEKLNVELSLSDTVAYLLGYWRKGREV